ncbi:MAG: trans-sulfuration enzyme family protein [Hyphomicrobiaceae bacterium]
MTRDVKPETMAAQAGGHIDAETGAIVAPIHITTTYERDPDNQYSRGYCYGRSDNATVRQGEAVLKALEGGAEALFFASGMAAATTVFLALPRPAHVVVPEVMYWGLRKWLVEDAPSLGITVSFVDATGTEAVTSAIRPGTTRLVWLETPANPTWGISDIAAIAQAAHAAGARVGVDSTVATPVLTRPIEHGADVVMHAATKYLNGHSDVVAGALIFARADEDAARAAALRNSLGAILGPFEAALLIRGMRTLHLRVRHQSAAALQIAEHFARHPRVEAVLYSGLPGTPGHDVARRQMIGGYSGMLSIRVKGGEAAAIRTAAAVKIWKRATSLGGVESLIEHRASVEGPTSPCPPDLLRLSVGVEHVDDLIADLEQALGANS